MGFGIDLLKGSATTTANALTGGLAGGLVDGIFGLFGGGRKDRTQRRWQEQMMQKQWENELEMQKIQHGYNLEIGEKNQEYAKEMSEIGYQQSLGLNQINYAQQKAMFDKQAEYNSAEKIKERLKKAGMNPALAFGGGATGTGGVSSGGGTGPGIGAGTAPGGAGPGTQAVMMGLQAKAIQSQIDVNKASARKINAEATSTNADLPKKAAETKVATVNADNIVEATKLIKEQQLSEQSKRALNEAEKNYKIRVTELQDAIEKLTNAKEAESWYLSRSIEMGTYKLSKEAEKIMKEIDGLEVDNDVKKRTADMIVEQTRQNIKSTMQAILESQSRITINEEQKILIGKTIEDLTSQIKTREGQLEINEKDVIGKLDVMREQLGLGKIKMDIEKDRLLVDTVLGLLEAASKMVKPGS